MTILDNRTLPNSHVLTASLLHYLCPFTCVPKTVVSAAFAAQVASAAFAAFARPRVPQFSSDCRICRAFEQRTAFSRLLGTTQFRVPFICYWFRQSCDMSRDYVLFVDWRKVSSSGLIVGGVSGEK